MATFTQRLRLKRHTTADRYRIQDYAENWAIIDGSPGTYICTADSHPDDWNTAHVGLKIMEMDTGLEWWWDGAFFRRMCPMGDLGSAQITANVQTSSTTLQTAVSLDVTVPPGGRAVHVTVSGPGVYNSVGVTRLALFRGETQLQSWLVSARLTSTATDQPREVSMSISDTPAAGPITYSLRYAAEVGYGGSSTLQAAIDKPLRLYATEV